MGYSGGKLEPLFSQTPVVTTLKDMAQKGGREFVRLTRQNTPIDDSPFPSRPPGTMRRSWYQLPVERVFILPDQGYQSGVATNDPIAPHVEWGTGLYGPQHAKYRIRPKKPGGWLIFYSRRLGTWVRTREVMHPGSPGQAMVRLAGAKLESELVVLLDPLTYTWARRQVRVKAGP